MESKKEDLILDDMEQSQEEKIDNEKDIKYGRKMLHIYMMYK